MDRKRVKIKQLLGKIALGVICLVFLFAGFIAAEVLPSGSVIDTALDNSLENKEITEVYADQAITAFGTYTYGGYDSSSNVLWHGSSDDSEDTYTFTFDTNMTNALKNGRASLTISYKIGNSGTGDSMKYTVTASGISYSTGYESSARSLSKNHDELITVCTNTVPTLNLSSYSVFFKCSSTAPGLFNSIDSGLYNLSVGVSAVSVTTSNTTYSNGVSGSTTWGSVSHSGSTTLSTIGGTSVYTATPATGAYVSLGGSGYFVKTYTTLTGFTYSQAVATATFQNIQGSSIALTTNFYSNQVKINYYGYGSSASAYVAVTHDYANGSTTGNGATGYNLRYYGRVGYTFLGWSKTNGSSTADYSPSSGTNVLVPASGSSSSTIATAGVGRPSTAYNLYAVWKLDDITSGSFNVAGGVVGSLTASPTNATSTPYTIGSSVTGVAGTYSMSFGNSLVLTQYAPVHAASSSELTYAFSWKVSGGSTISSVASATVPYTSFTAGTSYSYQCTVTVTGSNCAGGTSVSYTSAVQTVSITKLKVKTYVSGATGTTEVANDTYLSFATYDGTAKTTPAVLLTAYPAGGSGNATGFTSALTAAAVTTVSNLTQFIPTGTGSSKAFSSILDAGTYKLYCAQLSNTTNFEIDATATRNYYIVVNQYTLALTSESNFAFLATRTKVYDGSNEARTAVFGSNVTTTNVSGVNGETVVLNVNSATFNNVHANNGTATANTPNAVTFSYALGSDSGTYTKTNYKIGASAISTIGNVFITKRPATITWTWNAGSQANGSAYSTASVYNGANQGLTLAGNWVEGSSQYTTQLNAVTTYAVNGVNTYAGLARTGNSGTPKNAGQYTATMNTGSLSGYVTTDYTYSNTSETFKINPSGIANSSINATNFIFEVNSTASKIYDATSAYTNGIKYNTGAPISTLDQAFTEGNFTLSSAFYYSGDDLAPYAVNKGSWRIRFTATLTADTGNNANANNYYFTSTNAQSITLTTGTTVKYNIVARTISPLLNLFNNNSYVTKVYDRTGNLSIGTGAFEVSRIASDALSNWQNAPAYISGNIGNGLEKVVFTITVNPYYYLDSAGAAQVSDANYSSGGVLLSGKDNYYALFSIALDGTQEINNNYTLTSATNQGISNDKYFLRCLKITRYVISNAQVTYAYVGLTGGQTNYVYDATNRYLSSSITGIAGDTILADTIGYTKTHTGSGTAIAVGSQVQVVDSTGSGVVKDAGTYSVKVLSLKDPSNANYELGTLTSSTMIIDRRLATVSFGGLGVGNLLTYKGAEYATGIKNHTDTQITNIPSGSGDAVDIDVAFQKYDGSAYGSDLSLLDAVNNVWYVATYRVYAKTLTGAKAENYYLPNNPYEVTGYNEIISVQKAAFDIALYPMTFSGAGSTLVVSDTLAFTYNGATGTWVSSGAKYVFTYDGLSKATAYNSSMVNSITGFYYNVNTAGNYTINFKTGVKQYASDLAYIFGSAANNIKILDIAFTDYNNAVSEVKNQSVDTGDYTLTITIGGDNMLSTKISIPISILRRNITINHLSLAASAPVAFDNVTDRSFVYDKTEKSVAVAVSAQLNSTDSGGLVGEDSVNVTASNLSGTNVLVAYNGGTGEYDILPYVVTVSSVEDNSGNGNYILVWSSGSESMKWKITQADLIVSQNLNFNSATVMYDGTLQSISAGTNSTQGDNLARILTYYVCIGAGTVFSTAPENIASGTTLVFKPLGPGYSEWYRYDTVNSRFFGDTGSGSNANNNVIDVDETWVPFGFVDCNTYKIKAVINPATVDGVDFCNYKPFYFGTGTGDIYPEGVRELTIAKRTLGVSFEYSKEGSATRFSEFSGLIYDGLLMTVYATPSNVAEVDEGLVTLSLNLNNATLENTASTFINAGKYTFNSRYGYGTVSVSIDVCTLANGTSSSVNYDLVYDNSTYSAGNTAGTLFAFTIAPTQLQFSLSGFTGHIYNGQLRSGYTGITVNSSLIGVKTRDSIIANPIGIQITYGGTTLAGASVSGLSSIVDAGTYTASVETTAIVGDVSRKGNYYILDRYESSQFSVAPYTLDGAGFVTYSGTTSYVYDNTEKGNITAKASGFDWINAENVTLNVAYKVDSEATGNSNATLGTGSKPLTVGAYKAYTYGATSNPNYVRGTLAEYSLNITPFIIHSATYFGYSGLIYNAEIRSLTAVASDAGIPHADIGLTVKYACASAPEKTVVSDAETYIASIDTAANGGIISENYRANYQVAEDVNTQEFSIGRYTITNASFYFLGVDDFQVNYNTTVISNYFHSSPSNPVYPEGADCYPFRFQVDEYNNKATHTLLAKTVNPFDNLDVIPLNVVYNIRPYDAGNALMVETAINGGNDNALLSGGLPVNAGWYIATVSEFALPDYNGNFIISGSAFSQYLWVEQASFGTSADYELTAYKLVDSNGNQVAGSDAAFSHTTSKKWEGVVGYEAYADISFDTEYELYDEASAVSGQYYLAAIDSAYITANNIQATASSLSIDYNTFYHVLRLASWPEDLEIVGYEYCVNYKASTTVNGYSSTVYFKITDPNYRSINATNSITRSFIINKKRYVLSTDYYLPSAGVQNVTQKTYDGAPISVYLKNDSLNPSDITVFPEANVSISYKLIKEGVTITGCTATDAGTYTIQVVFINTDPNYSGIIYNGVPLDYLSTTLQIDKAKFGYNFTFEDVLDANYDGTEQTIDRVTTYIQGGSNLDEHYINESVSETKVIKDVEEVVLSGGAVNVGVYTVTISLNHNNSNYELWSFDTETHLYIAKLEDSYTATLKINKARLDIYASFNSGVETGSGATPTQNATPYFNQTLNKNTIRYDAIFADNTLYKLFIDVTSGTINSTNTVITIGSVSVNINYMISVLGQAGQKAGNSAANAGTYTVTASFTYPSGSYVLYNNDAPVETLYATLIIAKASFSGSENWLKEDGLGNKIYTTTYNNEYLRGNSLVTEMLDLKLQATADFYFYDTGAVNNIGLNAENSKRRDAGHYMAVVKFNQKGTVYNFGEAYNLFDNYNKPADQYMEVVINKCPISFNFSAYSFISANNPTGDNYVMEYNGNIRPIQASVTFPLVTPTGVSLTAIVTITDRSGNPSIAKNAGNYVAVANVSNINYTLSSGSGATITDEGIWEGATSLGSGETKQLGNQLRFTIRKANYLSTGGNTWLRTPSSNIYNKEMHSTELNGTLSTGLSVSYTIVPYDTLAGAPVIGETPLAGNGAINVGVYQVRAKFSDKDNWLNYNEVADKTQILTILKASIDISGISFFDYYYVVSSLERSISIFGTLPEGVSVSYCEGGSETVFSGKSAIGDYTVDAKLNLLDELNYKLVRGETNASGTLSAVLHITELDAYKFGLSADSMISSAVKTYEPSTVYNQQRFSMTNVSGGSVSYTVTGKANDGTVINLNGVTSFTLSKANDNENSEKYIITAVVTFTNGEAIERRIVLFSDLLIEKADYASSPAQKIISNIQYNPTAQLSNSTFNLDDEFSFWVNENTVPTVPVRYYPAYYNADPFNYNNHGFNVMILLSKAEYNAELNEVPSPGYFTGKRYNPSAKLSDFVLSDKLLLGKSNSNAHSAC